MPRPLARRKIQWLLVFVPLLIISFFLFRKTSPPTPTSAPPPPPVRDLTNLASLGLPPDWSQLERFQKTISCETFLTRLETVYTKDASWKKWIIVDEKNKQAKIGDFTLKFAETDQPAPGSVYHWKNRASLSPSRSLPLQGLHIALDPGHIGGSYASIEQRESKWGDAIIQEGTMTLLTAKTLAPMLEKLGASVTLVRTKLEPVTKKTSEDFSDPRLFYRTSEIRARARLVNESIKPDLVVCLHFNGSASRTPEPLQHFHIILNGTYAADEIAHEDERFQMLQRLLSGTIIEEVPLAREIAGACNDILKLPAYKYRPNLPTAQNVANHPNLWARNLLANRLYQCPVIFMEPYVMNSSTFITRFKQNPEEIYREYARAVADGLTRYYSQQ